MAKITVEFDTVEKTMVVKQDNQVLENVNSVNCYQYGKDACIEVNMSEDDEVNEVDKYTRICAADNDETKRIKLLAKSLFR